MRKFRLLFTAVALSASLTLSAQDKGHARGDKMNGVDVFYFSADNPCYNVDVIDIITQPTERHFLDPKAPRFLLVDSKKKFALGIGGVVRATTAIDFAGIIENSTNEGFETAYIPTSRVGMPKAQANMSAGQSEIFLKMVGKTKRLGAFQVYVSMNFMGENYTPQLRNAYVEFMGFSAGKRWSLFTDLDALPTTIDYAGPQSYGGYHVPQLRYARMFARERMQFGVSAEMPTVEALYGENDMAQPQSVPNFVGYLQANWEGGHVRASGLYRNMNYYDLEMSETSHENGWAVQLSGKAEISSRFDFLFQGMYGRGVASYVNDLSNLPLDMVPNPTSESKMQTLPTWGAYGSLKYDICDGVYGSTTYGYQRLYRNNGFTYGNLYRYTQYIATNMFWDITKECCIGVEYLRGVRDDYAKNSGTANRLNFMVQYCF